MIRLRINNGERHQSSILRSSVWKKVLIMVIVFAVVLNTSFIYNTTIVKAASVSVAINYIDETATLTPTGGSSKYYMSTDGKKTWECIETTTIDISTLLSTKEVLVYFKGNKDTDATALEVKLPPEDKSFAPAFKVTGGVGRIEFYTPLAVQYRKGTNGAWITATSNSMPTALYETKGATLYFRTAPQTGLRAGKVVAVKIPKRPSAPSVKVDGSKLCITGLKSGETQFRVGDSTSWSTFTTTTNAKYLDLLPLLMNGLTTLNVPIPAGIIEFRTPGNEKKLNSSVRVVEVAAQPTITSAIATVTGTAIRIIDTTKNYEYTTVAQGQTLNMSTAKWTQVNSKKVAIVTKVNLNDKVLIRAKSYIDTSKKLVLASTYVEYPITSLVAGS